MMRFDDILVHLGEFGRYQRQQYFMLSMVIFSCGIQVMMTVFTLALPDHRCAIPGLANDTYQIQNPVHSSMIDQRIPRETESESYSKCDLYSYEDTPMSCDHISAEDGPRNSTAFQNRSDSSNNSSSSRAICKCSSWVYDSTEFTSTIATQMNFVCGRNILKSHAMMTMMSGQMIGCLFLGPIADVVGRKRMMMVALTLHLCASVLITWAINIYMLGALYLLNGMALSAAYCSSFTLGMELIGPRWRHATGVAITGFWPLGMLWVCLLAYFLRDWQHLQLAASCPIILFALYFFLVPESARWLIRKGRYSEAEVIITRAAKTNRKDVPKAFFTGETTEQSKIVSESLLTIFKCPPLLLRALNVFFNWFACSLTYYGLGLNVGQLSGDIFLNFCLSAVFEIAAYSVIIVAMIRIGRKTLYCSSLLLGGLSCILTLFPVLYAQESATWAIRFLAMVGKFGVSGAFAIVWMFTSEMFPTSLRASIMGTSSCFARIGGVVASYIANLNVGGDVGIVLPQIILGSFGLMAGLIALFLPETRRMKLPESVQDAIKISRSDRTEENPESAEMKPIAHQED